VPTIVHSREIPLAAKALLVAAIDVLDRLADQSLTDAITLSANLGKGRSKVSVPIEITVTRRSLKDSLIALNIKARSATALFPVFKGTFHALAMSAARTTLRLRGTYRVPLGLVGSAVNAAGLHRFAEDSLRQLFDRVADESIATVREEASARREESRS
jgi:hypothetical protein